MKGTIKIYANTVDKEKTNFGIDVNLTDVSLTDKFSIIESLMDALEFSELGKNLFMLSQITGGFGSIQDKTKHDRDSEFAGKFISNFESMVSES